MKKFPVFKPVAKVEHIVFENDMLFTTPKQFKEAITEYVVHGGWGIRFVKNDLLSVRKTASLLLIQQKCQERGATN